MTTRIAVTAEHQRLADTAAGQSDWQRWGTYVSERAWGTVREDYSRDGSAWEYFPHDHARSRAYRWNEDGLAGFCDRQQHLCLAVALWNERDPILKERMFGLTNSEGNHGEDVKEYYFYLDNLPTHAYARMLYKYPQTAFPYAELVAENARRGTDDAEHELFDAAADAFREQRYFDVFVEYAKVDAEDILCRIEVVNRGPDAAPIHVLPHLWFRNTWSWDHAAPRFTIERHGPSSARTSHPALGDRWWYVRASDAAEPTLLFTENETNVERLFNAPNRSAHVKDAINDAVVLGRLDRVDAAHGSKAAADFRAVVAPGATFVVQVRLSPRADEQPFAHADTVFADRIREADQFYGAIHAPHLTVDERLVQRQAFAGLLWSKQFYQFDVHRWLMGDPNQPPPPIERRKGRNRDWWHFFNEDVLLMPDTWEYPWYASWDLAFQCVVMALLDPAFAKQQLTILTSPRYQHPYGSIPAFEWDFDAVNPPVIAWAAWQVYQIDRTQRGRGDLHFLESVFDPLLMMLSWWLNRKDRDGHGVFGGGFLGLDNVGVFDRDQPLPTGGSLEQSDGTGWMAMFQLNMVEIAMELAIGNPRYLPMVQRFGQHFLAVSNVMRRPGTGGGGALWDAEAGFYFDAIRLDGEHRLPLKIYSIVGLVPLFAASAIETATLERLPILTRSIDELLTRRPFLKETLPAWVTGGRPDARLLSVVDEAQLVQILQRVLDETQFLSEYGVRSLSREHLDRPYRFPGGGKAYEVTYNPGASNNRVFGGNSNWRGPVWFPLNFLLIQSLDTFARYYGDSLTVECPTGSGQHMTLGEVGHELARRLTGIFTRDDARGGRRAVLGDNEYFQHDVCWRDCIPFHEFFHGDDGTGLGASHQTGWTALVAILLQFGGALHFDRPWSEPRERLRDDLDRTEAGMASRDSYDEVLR